MNNTAIESSIKIQEGLSIVNFSNTIENVLLVEGKTDAAFYSQFPENNKNIHYGSPKEYNNIIKIVENKFRSKHYVYGIIDRDYKTHTLKPELQKFIFIIDANSLETVIIKYLGVDVFEKIIRKYFYQCKFIQNNFTKDSLQWSFILGCLREKNITQKLRLRINETVEQHDFLKEYVVASNSENNYFNFNIDLFLKDLLDNSNNQINYDELEHYIRDFNENESWFICRGHDVFDFIDALSRTVTNNKRDKSTVPAWEYKILHKAKSLFNYPKLEKWFTAINKK